MLTRIIVIFNGREGWFSTREFVGDRQELEAIHSQDTCEATWKSIPGRSKESRPCKSSRQPPAGQSTCITVPLRARKKTHRACLTICPCLPPVAWKKTRTKSWSSIRTWVLPVFGPSAVA